MLTAFTLNVSAQKFTSKWNMYLKRTEYFDKEGKLQGNKYKLQFIYLIGGRVFNPRQAAERFEYLQHAAAAG